MDLFNTAADITRRIPFGEKPAEAIELTGSLAQRIERGFFAFLRTRIDAAPSSEHSDKHQGPVTTAPRELMTDLLERSVRQDAATSKVDWFASVLAQLVPDEARIIAALAESKQPVPLLHVLPRSGHGRLLENASLVGRTAAVTLPQMTPYYVTHLRNLGLVDSGPEDEDNPRGYELLLADKAVRMALKDGEMGKFPARVLRRTLVLSARGHELWANTRPIE